MANPPKIARLPDANREQQLAHWGIDSTQRWDTPRYGTGPDDGGAASEAHSTGLDAAEREFLAGDGWGLAWAGSEDYSGGLRAHRGRLAEDEYVDQDVVRANVEASFGFTSAQVCSVYRQGRLSAEQRALRDRVDARLLEIYREGGDMALLAKVLGLALKNRECQAFRTALARAKATEERT